MSMSRSDTSRQAAEPARAGSGSGRADGRPARAPTGASRSCRRPRRARRRATWPWRSASRGSRRHRGSGSVRSRCHLRIRFSGRPRGTRRSGRAESSTGSSRASLPPWMAVRASGELVRPYSPTPYRWRGRRTGGRWDDDRLMSARLRPVDPVSGPGPDPGLDPSRPSLYRRLLGEGAGAHSARPTTASRPSSPSGSTRSSTSPSGWPLRTTGRSCSARSSTRPAVPCASTTSRSASSRRTGWSSRPGPDCRTRSALALPTFRVDEGWVAEILRTGQVAAWSDAREDGTSGMERYEGIVEFAGSLIAPLIHHDRVIGALSAVTRRAARRGPMATSPSSPPSRPTPASRSPMPSSSSRPRRAPASSTVLQAASGRLSRATSVEAVGPHGGRGDAPDHRLPQRPGLSHRAAGPGRADRLRGPGRGLRARRLRPAPLPLGEGFTGWVAEHGEPLLINDANSDPRGATIAGTDEVDESMLVVPMRYDGVTVGVITLSKLGLDGFDADDLRLLTILADQAATAVESARLLTRSQELASELRRLLDMSSELSESLDPRQVAEHHGRPPRAGDGRRRVRDQLLGPAGRARRVARLLPGRADRRRWSRSSMSPAIPRRCASSSARDGHHRRRGSGRRSGRGRAAAPGGNRMLAMLPLVAKGQSIGLVELFSKTAVRWDDERLELARTMANEAAMALENARLYEDARKLADRDPLTGFYNHRFLHERLGEEVVRSQRGRRPLSVLMLDLDDFKLVNDTFGHLFGDRVLTWTAELIRSTLRAPTSRPATAATSSRSSCPRRTRGGAPRRRAHPEAFRERPFVGEQRGPVPIAASIGVATFPADGRTGTDLIAAADAPCTTSSARAATMPPPRPTGRIGRKYRARERPSVPSSDGGPTPPLPILYSRRDPPHLRPVTRPTPRIRGVRPSRWLFSGPLPRSRVRWRSRHGWRSGTWPLDWFLLAGVVMRVPRPASMPGRSVLERRVRPRRRRSPGPSRACLAPSRRMPSSMRSSRTLARRRGADHVVVVRRRGSRCSRRGWSARIPASRTRRRSCRPATSTTRSTTAGRRRPREPRAHRPPRPRRVWPGHDPRRAADRRRPGRRRHRPVAPDRRPVAGDHPPALDARPSRPRPPLSRAYSHLAAEARAPPTR